MNRRELATDNVSQVLGWYHGCVVNGTGGSDLGRGPCAFCREQAAHGVRAVAARPVHPAGKGRGLTAK